VVPNLNGARYLADALGSVFGQTTSPIEAVVVDGGSTDGSADVASAFAGSHHTALRWVSGPDRGQADAINKGIAMATGDVVGWLNADDILEPGAIETVVDAFGRDPSLDFVWGFCLVIDDTGRPLYVQNPFVRELAHLRDHRNFVPQPGTFFRRSLIDRFGQLDISYEYMFDYEFLLRLAGNVKARFIPEVLARFRIHPGSKTSRHYRAFLKEERRAFRSRGGRLMSPFTLDMWRYQFVSRPVDVLKAPLRRLLWRVLGLPIGSRIRP
jgi:glycosyltransferase involved in cell wall biosynthesis